MEYIEGGNLIDRIYDKPFNVRESAQLVAVLARAMHAVHEKGIVHRDLKPANILLQNPGPQDGPLPIPKITDFGLAKHLGEGAGQTRTGDVMGTPSYMAPEQAEGRVKDIGPHTDVYALGAILYEMLTARPPFKAETAMDTLLQVLYEEPVAPARLLPGCPRDLETICLKCLHKEIGRRYTTALDLALDLERFLDHQPIAARPTSRWERAWKWARRRPAAAALVLLSIIAPVVVLLLSLGYNVELAAAADRERSKALEAEQERGRAETNFQEAKKQEKEAQRRRQEAERLKTIAEENRRRAEQSFRMVRDTARQLIEALADKELGDQPAVKAVRQRLLGQAVLLQTQYVEKETNDPEARYRTALAYQQLGEIYRIVGDHDKARDAYLQSIDRLKTLTARGGGSDTDCQRELGLAYFHMGELHRDLGRPDQAEKPYREALAIQTKLAASHPEDPLFRVQQARTINDLALALALTDRLDDARKSYEEAIAVQEKLVADLPGRPDAIADLAGSWNDLGKLFRSLDRHADAHKAYEKACEHFDRLARSYPHVLAYQRKLASALTGLGNVTQDLQRPEEAIPKLREALDYRSKLVHRDPAMPLYREDLADAHNNLARSLAAGTQFAAAEQECAAARSILLALAKQYPAVSSYSHKVGSTIDNLARIRLNQKQYDKALELLDQALPHHQKAAKDSPDHAGFRQQLAGHYLTRAEVFFRLAEKGDLARATDSARAVEELVKRAGKSADYHWKGAVILALNARLAAGDKKQADALAARAVELLRKATELGPVNLQRLEDEKYPEFAALRGRTDFHKLLTDMKSKSPR
jgi:tetratricopeptide (TPR) repeat protein